MIRLLITALIVLLILKQHYVPFFHKITASKSCWWHSVLWWGWMVSLYQQLQAPVTCFCSMCGGVYAQQAVVLVNAALNLLLPQQFPIRVTCVPLFALPLLPALCPCCAWQCLVSQQLSMSVSLSRCPLPQCILCLCPVPTCKWA